MKDKTETQMYIILVISIILFVYGVTSNTVKEDPCDRMQRCIGKNFSESHVAKCHDDYIQYSKLIMEK